MGLKTVMEDRPPRKALFFCNWEKGLQEYFPLFDQLKARNFRCSVLIDGGCSKDWQEKLSVSGVDFVVSGTSLHKEKRPDKTPKPRNFFWENMTRSTLGIELRQARIFLATIIEFFRLKKYFEPLFDRFKPDIIILPGEGNLRRMVPLKIAQGRSIPSLILPVFYVTEDYTHDLFSKEKGSRELQSPASLLNRLLMRAHPQYAYNRNGLSFLRDPGGEMLATKILGVLPKNPWTFGTGLGTCIAVQNKYEYDRMIAQGVDPEKLSITGKPREDGIANKLQENVQEKRRSLGLDPQKKVVLLALPQYAEHRMLSWPEHWQEIRFLLETFGRVEGVQLVLSISPDTDDKIYREFVQPYKGTLPAVYDAFSLLGICDVYASDASSSTLAVAIAAKKPVIMFNFVQPEVGPLYKGVPIGGIYVTRHEELWPALMQLLRDPKVYEQAVALQEKAAKSLGMLDGCCTQRVVSEIERLVAMAGGGVRGRE